MFSEHFLTGSLAQTFVQAKAFEDNPEVISLKALKAHLSESGRRLAVTTAVLESWTRARRSSGNQGSSVWTEEHRMNALGLFKLSEPVQNFGAMMVAKIAGLDLKHDPTTQDELARLKSDAGASLVRVAQALKALTESLVDG